MIMIHLIKISFRITEVISGMEKKNDLIID